MKNAVQDSASERDEHGFLTKEREGSKTRTKFSKPPTYIYDLDFADDIALLENSRDSCQAQLSTVSKRAGQVGLVINDKKTVVMFNQPKQRNQHPNTQITLNGHEIQNVTDYKYLGSMMRSIESDFQTRRGQAWNAFGR